jgi:hypothetical protein
MWVKQIKNKDCHVCGKNDTTIRTLDVMADVFKDVRDDINNDVFLYSDILIGLYKL